MTNNKHESIKKMVSDAIEAAAISLVNANQLGEQEAYRKQLKLITSEIHKLYMQTYILNKTAYIGESRTKAVAISQLISDGLFKRDLDDVVFSVETIKDKRFLVLLKDNEIADDRFIFSKDVILDLLKFGLKRNVVNMRDVTKVIMN